MRTRDFAIKTIVFVFSMTISVWAQAQIKLEAETYKTATSGSTPIVLENAGATVGYFDEQGERLTYTINIPTAGFYELSLRYLAGAAGNISVTTATGAKGMLNFNALVSDTWWTTPLSNWLSTDAASSPLYYLEAGSQTLTLESTGTGINLDYIQIAKSSETNTAISNIVINPAKVEIMPTKRIQISANALTSTGRTVAAPITWSANVPNGLYSAGTATGVETANVSVGGINKTIQIKIAMPSKKRNFVVTEFGKLNILESTPGAGDWAMRGEKRQKASLSGPSLFWSCSAPAWWKKETIDWLVDDWHIQVVRCPVSIAPGMYDNTAPFGQYSPVYKGTTWNSNNYYRNPQYAIDMMDEVIAAAIENDIYVIIDFHDHHSQMFKKESIAFFDYFSKKWGKYPNVLYEIFNEPFVNEQVNQDGYADDVCKTIRANDPTNIIIIGSKFYSRDPAYGASFYRHGNIAGTWHGYVENNHQADWAANPSWGNGTAVVVTEWGRKNGDDGGMVQIFKNKGVMNCTWTLNNKQTNGDESWSAFNTGVTKSSNWTDADLCANGKWMREMMRGYGYVPSAKIDPDAVTLTCDGDKTINLPSNSITPAVTASTGFGTVSFAWTQISGPNTATFSSKTIASPTIGSLVVGVYKFKLTAGNGIDVQEANVKVTVLPQGYIIPVGGDVVDNIEDNNTTTIWGGTWSVFDDSGDKGASTITPANNLPNNKAILAAYTLNKGGWAYNPYCGVRVSMKNDGTAKDLTKCTKITYRYKGAAHDFRVEMASITDNDFHKIAVPASSVWTTVTIDWANLAQDPTWGVDVGAINKTNIDNFSWQVSAANGSGTIEIDDLTCVGAGSESELQFVSLSAGWNLISTNIQAVDNSIATLFKGLDVQEIKTMNSFWSKTQADAFNSLSTISTGAGYLVKMNTAGILIVVGAPVQTQIVASPQAAGWNLIGCPYQSTTAFAKDFNATNCAAIKNFDGFWIPNGTINSVSEFEPGKAYFVKGK